MQAGENMFVNAGEGAECESAAVNKISVACLLLESLLILAPSAGRVKA
jgi:hypothetical protein